jgi:ApbE superfamily uncharacterized protein (UPF0280 family)
MYQPRTYRHWVRGEGLVSFKVVYRETDLYIRASTDLSGIALDSVIKYRNILESYIKERPAFATSLEPLDVEGDAPAIIRDMADAAAKAGVGPMASVAGAIAQFVSQELLPYSPEVIIENGGDIYIKSLKDRTVGIYAGDSPLSGKVGLTIKADDTPLAICTSSGTVGHSLSYGKADAVVAVSESASIADAAATAIGNIVRTANDIQKGIGLAAGIDALSGVVIIIGDKIGISGDLKICSI